MKAFFQTSKGIAILIAIAVAVYVGRGLSVRNRDRENKEVNEAKVHFGLSSEVPKIQKLDAGEWSPPIVLLDNRVRTYPIEALVEFKDVETGKVTTVGPHNQVHLKGVNIVRIRSKEKIRYIVERQ